MTVIVDSPDRLPVPDRFSTCGLVLALSVMLSVPVRVPKAVGLNVTETKQLAPAANVLGESGQLFVCVKSPLVAILPMVRGTA